MNTQICEPSLCDTTKGSGTLVQVNWVLSQVAPNSHRLRFPTAADEDLF